MRHEIAFFMMACGTRTALDDESLDASRSDALVVDSASGMDAGRDSTLVDSGRDVAMPTLACPKERDCVCPNDGGSCFDRGSCVAVLGAANLAPCAGPIHYGHARITFIDDGTVSSVIVDDPPALVGTSQASCAEAVFGAVCMEPFCWDPVTVGKSFSLP